ncbi:rhodanese-like domain-containing protein [Brachybacterium paraconglomeratum]
MKRQNVLGPTLLGERALPRRVDASEISSGMASGAIARVGTRPVAGVHAGMVPGALSIPAPGKAASHIGWAFDPESDDAEIIVLASDAETAARIQDHFVRVGIDELGGYVTSFEWLEQSVPQRVSPADLDQLRSSRPHAVLLDVRNKSEHSAGTIPVAPHLSAERALFHRDQLFAPAEGAVIAFCQSGLRASVAANPLRRAGHEVIELDGSYAGWSRWLVPPAAGERRAGTRLSEAPRFPQKGP